MRLALYQPDIPQNTGTILRMSACLSVPVDIIEPAGFNLGDRALRRAGLDYLELVSLKRHMSFQHFMADRPAGRLILLSTHGQTSHTDFAFEADDTLLLGRESEGAPDHVHDCANATLRIPVHPETRSLNIAIAAAIVLGEALRQIDGFPET